MTSRRGGRSPLPALAFAAAAALYAIAFLAAESQWAIGALICLAAAAIVLAARLRWTQHIGTSIAANERTFDYVAIAAVLLVALVFHEDHFILLMLTTALVLMVPALGLTMQFGHAGIANFAGAAFLGIGCYTAAVVTTYTPLPALASLPLGGLMAALIGSILILPILRTRGHYAALITIAFGVLFKVFIEVNDVLGGPQGMQVKPLILLGWNFNSPIMLAGGATSFYFAYLVVALLLVVASFALLRRLERSWIGLSLDAIRLDEIAAACYGLAIARWKVLAFVLGNFLAGVAGALYGHVLGFIAPNNFTFGDSLLLVSIVLLGGIGSIWGVVVAAPFVVILPEKLQVIQEYRIVLFAGLVILILLFRPEGFIPRPLRRYPGLRTDSDRPPTATKALADGGSA